VKGKGKDNESLFVSTRSRDTVKLAKFASAMVVNASSPQPCGRSNYCPLKKAEIRQKVSKTHRTSGPCGLALSGILLFEPIEDRDLEI